MRSLYVCGAALTVLVLSRGLRASNVTYDIVDSSPPEADAFQSSTGNMDSPVGTVPGSGTLDAVEGSNSSSGTYQINDSIISFNDPLQQDGNISGSNGSSYADGQGDVWFTANSALPYSLSDSLSVTAGTNNTSQQVTFYNVTAGGLAVYSDATSTPSLLSNSGTLVSGDLYFVDWDNDLIASSGAGSADSQFTFTIGNVPEPATTGLLFLGAVGFLKIRRRRSR